MRSLPIYHEIAYTLFFIVNVNNQYAELNNNGMRACAPGCVHLPRMITETLRPVLNIRHVKSTRLGLRPSLKVLWIEGCDVILPVLRA